MKKRMIAAMSMIGLLSTLLTACSSQAEHMAIERTNLTGGAFVTASQPDGASNLTDGSRSTWKTTQPGASVEIDFGKEVTFNTIVLREPTDSVRQFTVYYWDGRDYTFLYQQDRIDQYRLCAVETTTSSKVKIVFDRFDQKLEIEEIEIYQLDNYYRDDFKVTSYLNSNLNTETGLTDVQAQAEDPGYVGRFQTLTDVIFIGVVFLDADGTLTCSSGLENFKTDVELLKRFNPDMKVRCTIMMNFAPGDFNANKKAIVKFVNSNLDAYQKNLTAFVEETGLDGVDFDWEYPQLPHEWSAYSKLLIASKAAIHGRDLSVALWPYGVKLSKQARACIDNVNIMAYDQFDKRGDHSSVYEMGLNAIEYFLKLGFSKEQLCLGIPFYGRTADTYNIWPPYDEGYGKWANYRENFTYKDDDGVEHTSTVFLNGYAMVRDKTALALQNDLGGIMIFSTTADISFDSEYPLHKAVIEVLDQRLVHN